MFPPNTDVFEETCKSTDSSPAGRYSVNLGNICLIDRWQTTCDLGLENAARRPGAISRRPLSQFLAIPISHPTNNIYIDLVLLFCVFIPPSPQDGAILRARAYPPYLARKIENHLINPFDWPSVKIAWYWPRSFFRSLRTSTRYRSIYTEKRTWQISSHLDPTLPTLPAKFAPVLLDAISSLDRLKSNDSGA